ncbi:MAG: bifunctional DNA primase/polymerase [Anaerolineae bacterium]|nr:bifunctional DNA primase/polymerase [Anaerolineae bacterium]
MHESCDSYAESLYFAAESLILSNFAVIPVFGAQDSSRIKQAAVKWGRFQHTLPTRADLQNWFLHERFGGLAVVCGAVSRLVVLDFDDPGLVSEFRHLFPNLIDTYTVRSGSRGLPHYYWRLPVGMVVPSRSVRGADLRGEGTYVVAPPTRAGDCCWTVENDAEPRLLSKSDLRLILGFMATATSISPTACFQTPSRAISTPSIDHDQPSELRHLPIPFNELLMRYQQFVPLGRNNALFQVAVQARDSGWVQHSLAMCLAPVHARQQASDGTTDEGYQQRYTEAVRTIASVYRRPARKPQGSVPSSYLSNPVRETLLKSDQVQTARVLDGLYLSGMCADALFTEREACSRLAVYGIPRAAVLAALKACAADGLPLFPPLTPQTTAIAADDTNRLYKKCEMNGGANRVKNSRGRPARYYKLPSSEMLAARFGVANRKGDPIRAADLSSPAAYRLALHRELIRRRPAQYPRFWLSARLGVSEWTTRRYEQAAKIEAQPMYMAQDITWVNLNALLPEVREAVPMNVFIEDEDGKRYPPVRGIARLLLKAGFTLRRMQQMANYYAPASSNTVGVPTLRDVNIAIDRIAERPIADSTVGVPTPHQIIESVIHPRISINSEVSTAESRPEAVGVPTPADDLHFWLCEDCLKVRLKAVQPDACPKCGTSNWQRVPDAIWRDNQRLKVWWQKLYRAHYRPRRQSENPVDPLLPNPDEEAFARRLHDQTPDLSLRSARNLIRRYGMKAVGQGIKLLHERRNVRNPAGFLVTVARSEHKFL